MVVERIMSLLYGLVRYCIPIRRTPFEHIGKVVYEYIEDDRVPHLCYRRKIVGFEIWHHRFWICTYVKFLACELL
jgi:hypothetical protein